MSFSADRTIEACGCWRVVAEGMLITTHASVPDLNIDSQKNVRAVDCSVVICRSLCPVSAGSVLSWLVHKLGVAIYWD